MRKLKIHQLITIVLAITLSATVLVGIMLFYPLKTRVSTEEAVETLGPPGYLFSIYGREDKPLKSPMGVYVNKKGSIYVASTNNHEIQVFGRNGRHEFTFGEPGSEPGQLLYPYGIVELDNGNLLVSETGNGRIQEYTAEGKFIREVLTANTTVKVDKPGPMLFKEGVLYIGDLVKHQVIAVRLQKDVQPVAEFPGINYPHGIGVDRAGRVYISDAGGYRIGIFKKNGEEERSIREWQPGSKFSMLRGLALDKYGRIFVADTINSSIRVFSADGIYLFSLGEKGYGNGQFLFPTGILVDSNNRIYIADWGNNRVEVWGYQ